MNGVTEFEPGASLQTHCHNCEESDVVLEGRAWFDCDGDIVELRPGDTTWVPAGTWHWFGNAGSEDLRILWSYGSADPTRTFADTGETISVLPPRP
jgi:mannose-6-phosphate isomerase-like protein (cupin superfamily)